MSQIVIGITTEQLGRVDALCKRHGLTREQFALAGLEAHLAKSEAAPAPVLEPKPKFKPAAFHGADKEENA